MPINPEFLATYFNAATAAAAVRYGVRIKRISLKLRNGRRERPRLMPLTDYVQAYRGAIGVGQAHVDYATTLLAGSVGHWLGLERHLAYSRPQADLGRLEQAHLAEALMCAEPETDRAFAIILGRLNAIDGGDSVATFKRLWRRASQLLRQQPHWEHLERIMEALRERRVLNGREVLEILQA